MTTASSLPLNQGDEEFIEVDGIRIPLDLINNPLIIGGQALQLSPNSNVRFLGEALEAIGDGSNIGTELGNNNPLDLERLAIEVNEFVGSALLGTAFAAAVTPFTAEIIFNSAILLVRAFGIAPLLAVNISAVIFVIAVGSIITFGAPFLVSILQDAFIGVFEFFANFDASNFGPLDFFTGVFAQLGGVIDPLVIDLDGDGVNTTNVNDSGVTFDLDNNGSEEGVGWFEAEDGILVQDWKGDIDEDGNRIGDGEAQDRSELFATFDELSRHDLNGDGILDASDVGPQATQDTNGDGEINTDDVVLPDGLEDVNGDGVIDINDIDERAQDANGDGIITEDEIEQPTFTGDLDGDGVLDTVDVGYDQVQVWIDANQNGNVDEGELSSLADLGIASIDLNETPLDVQDNGNIINSESTVTLDDGSELIINGIDLFRDTIDQSYEQQINNLDLSPERLAERLDVFTLPQIQGSGNVPPLLIAALASDSVLEAWRAVGEYNGGSFVEFGLLVDELIFEWSGANELINDDRGAVVPKVLNAIEEFLGTEYIAPGAPEGTVNSNPVTPREAALIQQAFDQFADAIALRLFVQNRSILNANNPNADDLRYDFTTDSFTGDWSGLIGSLEAQYNDNDVTAREKIAIFNLLAQAFNVVSTVGDSLDLAAASQIRDVLNSINVVNLSNDFAEDYFVGNEDGDNAPTIVEFFNDDGDLISRVITLAPGIVAGNSRDNEFTPNNATNVGGGVTTVVFTPNEDYIYAGNNGSDTYRIPLSFINQDRPDNGGSFAQIFIDNEVLSENSGRLILDSIENVDFHRSGQDLVLVNSETGVPFALIEGQFRDRFNRIEEIIYNGDLNSGSSLTADIDANNDGILTADDIERLSWNRGTEGADLIRSQGNIVDQTFFGDLGDDILIGRNGSDTYIYRAGDGNDTIDETNTFTGTDRLHFENLTLDQVEIRRTADDLIIHIISTGQEITVLDQFGINSDIGLEEIIFNGPISVGTDGSIITSTQTLTRQDILALAQYIGDSGINIILGSGDDETFTGSQEDDFISGAEGSDTYIYSSGDGNDIIYDVFRISSAGIDILQLTDLTRDQVEIKRRSDNEDDVVIVDLLTGQEILIPFQFREDAAGRNGLEQIIFADGQILDRVELRQQAIYFGTDASETIIGGDDVSVFDARGGDDLLIGNNEADTYIYRSGDGNDTIEDFHRFGFDDPDTLKLIDLNLDQITLGRLNNDLFIIDNTTGQRITVSGQFGSGSLQNGLENIEFADGSSLSRADIANQVIIFGTNADDTLTGSSGSDTFDGGLGDDTLDGQNEADTYIYRSGDGNDVINDIHTTGFSDPDTLILVDLNIDQITLGRLNGELFVIDNATEQRITINGQFGSGSLQNGVESIVFADGSTISRAEIEAQAIIFGTDGNDTLTGGRGNQSFNGGLGDDLLVGGDDSDTYIYSSGGGNDTIEDFHRTGLRDPDTLRFTDLNAEDLIFKQSGDNLIIIDTSTGQTVTILSQFNSGSLQRGVENIVLANGQTLTRTDINNLAVTNTAPIVVNPLTDQTFIEDSAVLFTIPSDAFAEFDGEELTLTATLDGGEALPLWLTFDSQTGDFSGTPPQDFDGTLDITVTASDGTFEASDGFTIDIVGVNDAPILSTPLSNQASPEDEAVNFTLPVDAFSDVDGDTLTLTATLADGSDLPNWLVFDGASFSGTPPRNFSGSLDVIVTATDGEFEVIDTFILDITAVNDAPTVTNPLVDQSSPEDEAVSFVLPLDAFVDEDGGALNLTATLADGSDLPVWLTFNGTTFSGTPPQDFNGVLEVTVTASDGELEVTDTFTLEIAGVNDAPILTAALIDQSSAEDEAVSFTLPTDAFIDVDGDELTLIATLVGGAALPLWLTFDADAGSFSGTPPQNFNGSLDIVVTASDGEFNISDSFTLDIVAVNDAPIVGIPLSDQSSPEDEAVSFTLPADAFSDVDGDALALSATLVDGSDLPSWLMFNGSSFSGIPPQDFNGTLNVVLTASDGELEVSDTFALSIAAVNDAPIVGVPLADQSSTEDEAVSFALPSDTFSDVDGDELSLTAMLAGGSDLPEWLTFDAANGTFTGTPPQDFDGSLDVVVTATDGEFEVSDTFTLNITSVNDAPILITPLSDQSSPEDETVNFSIPTDSFSDVDGDTLTLTVALVNGAVLPSWLTFDAIAGTFSGAPPQDFNGSLDVVVTATDGEFEVSDTFTLDITSVNDAPILITPLADQSSPEDAGVSFALPDDAFNDADGDDLTLTATLIGGAALPLWLTFDAQAGTFSGTPPQDFNGVLDIIVTATDGEFEANDTFTLNIDSVNDVPIVSPPLSDQSSLEDEAVNFVLPENTFIDADGDALTLSAALADGSELPSWLTFDGDTRTFSGTPPQDFNTDAFGALNVRVTASDGQVSVSDDFSLEIIGVNDGPVAEDDGVFNTEQGASTLILNGDLLANDFDADGDELSITSVTSSGSGTVEINDDGNIIYAPETGFVGEDTFTYTITDGEETSTATVTVSVNEDDTIPDDAIVGSDGTDFIGGTNGDDTIFGEGGNDFLSGGRGNDTINGGAGNDIGLGGRGRDTLNGGSGNDLLLGGRGADTLNGDEGNDFLLGGRGRDIISGGEGNDFLLGGRGSDTFIFNTGDGRDVIGDFSTGNGRGRFFSGGDNIAINVDGISSFDELMGFATQNGNSVSFAFENGDELILANTRLAALDRDAFTFF